VPGSLPAVSELPAVSGAFVFGSEVGVGSELPSSRPVVLVVSVVELGVGVTTVLAVVVATAVLLGAWLLLEVAPLDVGSAPVVEPDVGRHEGSPEAGHGSAEPSVEQAAASPNTAKTIAGFRLGSRVCKTQRRKGERARDDFIGLTY
jgi:hypothetical protein